MAFRDAVGGYPKGLGSEEAHRPAVATARRPAGPAAGAAALVTGASRARALPVRRRFRLQAAGLFALALIAFVTVTLPSRTLHVLVDGTEHTIHSRSVDNTAAVAHSGIEMHSDDVVDDANGRLIVRRATEALLTVDGSTFAVRTQAPTIAALLSDAGIELGPQDSVYRNGKAVLLDQSVAASTAGPLRLDVRRAVSFSVLENGQELQLSSSGASVAAALRDVGMRIGPGDDVQPSLSTELTAGLEIQVDHARQLVVTMPEGKAMLYTRSATVGEALTSSGMTLPSDYRLDLPEDTPIAAGLAVHIVGISSELVLETERIQSSMVYQGDPDLPAGAQRVVEGHDGVYYRQYAMVYENGQLQSRQVSAEWYDPQPVDTVVYYSTAPAVAARPADTAPQAAYSGNWQDLVCSYDWDCSWALAVIACESGGNANAYNAAGYVGLFQIWEGYGPNLRDPATNIAAAYSLYVSGGRGNWPNCP